MCFIESVKDQFPEDVVLKLKHDVRTEHVSIPNITKICKRNKLFVNIRMDKHLREHIKCGDAKTALFKADICKVGDHYFRFIEDTGVTSYYLKHYEALKHKADGHRFGRKDQRAKKFMNSFRLVDELMKNKAKLLEDAPYDLIREFRSEKIDTEKVYDFNVPSCCEPIENPASKEHKPKAPPINIYFDCETYTTKRFKHIPYLVCLKSDEESQPFKSKYCLRKCWTTLRKSMVR